MRRYNFTTGKYPFEGENIYRLFENISRGRFEVPKQCDAHLSSLLKGMLTYDAAKRLTIPVIKKHE